MHDAWWGVGFRVKFVALYASMVFRKKLGYRRGLSTRGVGTKRLKQ